MPSLSSCCTLQISCLGPPESVCAWAPIQAQTREEPARNGLSSLGPPERTAGSPAAIPLPLIAAVLLGEPSGEALAQLGLGDHVFRRDAVPSPGPAGERSRSESGADEVGGCCGNYTAHSRRDRHPRSCDGGQQRSWRIRLAPFLRIGAVAGVLAGLSWRWQAQWGAAGAAALRPGAAGGGFGNIRPIEGTGWIGFLNVVKYPPSLALLLFTLGADGVLLYLFEKGGPALARWAPRWASRCRSSRRRRCSSM
jgi:hypothetical protein